VSEMITGQKKLPFSKIISGTLDADKMDYLMRDAHHCNIPYGDIDIERLIESFVPDAARRRFAITEKGIAPLESVMFAKYMMMRNVYWHHTVRTFSVMLKRFVQDALDGGFLSLDVARHVFYTSSDENILQHLKESLSHCRFEAVEILDAIIERRPYKRALTLAAPYAPTKEQQWMFAFAMDAKHRKEKELELCGFLNRKHHLQLSGVEIIIDAPSTKNIFDYEDFRDLRLYRETKGKNKSTDFSEFDECGESAFTSKFILEFERATKKFRLTARADIVALLEKNQAQVIAILES
jgi:uncharacterized protein